MLFYLTAKGLQNINKELFESDFSIEFNNFKYKCPTLLAEFISPKIKLLRKENSSINTFKIDMTLNHAEESIYQLEKLMYGFPISLNDSKNNEDEILSILFSLGNIEIFNTETFKNITMENAISLFHLKKKNNADYQNEIDFISSYFYAFKEELKTFDVNDLSAILNSSNLTIENEYSLFTFIKEMIAINASYTPLLLYLKPEFIPQQYIEEFVSLIDSLDESYIKTLWPMLRNHYLQNNQSYLPSRHLGISIYYNESQPWDGLFSYYKKKNGVSDIISNGYISINSTSQGSGNINSIINSMSDFDTNNSPNQTIQITFNNYFCLKAYQILTPSSLDENLRSWIIEGLNINDEWVKLDERNDDFHLVERNQQHLFNISNNIEFCRSFRLIQTGVNHGNSNFLSLARIEFYGILKHSNSN